MANKFSKVIKSLSIATACLFASSAFGSEVLKVGTEATFAPFEFMDKDANAIGYDIDIIKAIGKEIGYDVSVANMPFDGLIPALLTNQIDVAIAAITITPDRAKKVAFTNSYYKSGISIVINKKDVSKYKDVVDLKGKTLCSQIGTTGAIVSKELSDHTVNYNTLPEAFMDLQAGGCDAVVNDRPVNAYFLKVKGNDQAVEMDTILSAEDYAIAVNKGNEDLLKKLNEGLAKIKQNGEFEKIHQKWFGTNK